MLAFEKLLNTLYKNVPINKNFLKGIKFLTFSNTSKGKKDLLNYLDDLAALDDSKTIIQNISIQVLGAEEFYLKLFINTIE